MDQEIEKTVQAIAIASDPLQGSLHQEALAYLSSVQQNANETWRLAVPLFFDANQDGTRKYPPQARFFALRVLDEFLDNRFEHFDQANFQHLQQIFMSYIQSEYLYGSAEAGATFLRNKFSHTLTLFFLSTYIEQWESFFPDLFSLIRSSQQQSTSSQSPTYNRHVALLFFHVILEISGEVADQIIKSARSFSAVRLARDTRVRDLVRERDAARINEAVLAIVSDEASRMSQMQKGDGNVDAQALNEVVEVVDLGVRTFGSYVGWIDINLTVTPTTVPLMFQLLADASLPIRLATSVTLLRIVAKGLKEPQDKLQLLKVLSLGQVIDALETKTRQQQLERGEDADEGEESYREALGKLLNVLGLEVTKLEDAPDEAVRSEAAQLLAQMLPVLLRFTSDTYDDTSSTVFPFLQTILANYKRLRKVSPSEPLDENKRSFLTSLLRILIDKLKWDEEAEPGDPDDDDNAEFEKMRKDLRTFMDSVLAIDQDLVTDAVRTLALNTVTAFRNGISMKWNEAELGIYMVYIFGEINKSGGKGRAAFCYAPPMADREQRRAADFSQYPLTTHGELLLALIESGMSGYPHPAVALQFFETVSRYTDFFKVRKECIIPVLESMVDSRGLHSSNDAFRLRLCYLLYRFLKECRTDIPPDMCATIANSFRDLLLIVPKLPDPEEVETDMLTDAVKDATFDSQLYLYETIGILCSIMFKSPQEESELLMSFVQPLMDDLSSSLTAYSQNSQDALHVVKTRHIIMALGNVAKGFPDYPQPPVPEGYILPPVNVFGEIGQAILVCLQAMNVYRVVRDATRFAFARIMATAGPTVTHFIPPLMSNLLVHFDPSELTDFMNFIGLLIFKLQEDMFDVLDELIGPLSGHISSLLAQPVTGSDDEISHVDTKRAYIALLNGIMSSKLHSVLISERNNTAFNGLLQSMQGIAEDVSDLQSQKAVFMFFSRCVTAWAQPESSDGSATSSLQGFDRVVYERLVPTAFTVPNAPQLNPKDGQTIVVIQEIANFLHTIGKTRGQEAYEFFLNVFLPSQNWPADTAADFTSKLRDLDARNFRKYFTEFVRSSRS